MLVSDEAGQGRCQSGSVPVRVEAGQVLKPVRVEAGQALVLFLSIVCIPINENQDANVISLRLLYLFDFYAKEWGANLENCPLITVVLAQTSKF